MKYIFVRYLTIFYFNLVRYTSRIDKKQLDNLIAYLKKEGPVICSFWHCNLVSVIDVLSKSETKIAIMVSRHSDASYLRALFSLIKIKSICGSGTPVNKKTIRQKGGAFAFRRSIKALQQGYNTALTADIPKGPAQKASTGSIKLSQISGRPILPISVRATRYIRLNTWDKLIIPLPFNKMQIIVGEPIYINRNISDTEIKEQSQKLQLILNRIVDNYYEK